jgi:hypothetical protein
VTSAPAPARAPSAAADPPPPPDSPPKVETPSKPDDPPAGAFPPPAFAPPFPRTASEGDGTWTPFVPAGAGEAALLYKTTVHPDAVKPQIYVVVVAIDLARVGIHLVAGTHEPLSEEVPPQHRPGLIPPADLQKLIAVTNGGFMTRHGNWGMVIRGETFQPPQPEGCSVALLDGRVEIRTHAALTHKPSEMRALRQTPPCLVERGKVNPFLLGAEKPRAWGMSETGGIDIRRSALGVSPDGRTLFYGLGEWVTPRQMAETMRVAGALDVAELDVNWSYTRFLLYGPGPTPEVTETLIPKTKHAPGQYVRKPAERDFFYLVRR